MEQPRQRYTFDRVVRGIISIAILVAIFALLRYLSDVLIPFAIAVVLAYLLNPLVDAFERKTGRRGVAVAATLGLLAITATTLLVLLVPLVTSQVARFQRSMNRLAEDMAASVEIQGPPPPAVLPEFEENGDEPLPDDAAPAEKSTMGLAELVDAWPAFVANPDELSGPERFARLRQAVNNTYIGDGLEHLATYVGSSDFRQRLVQVLGNVAEGGLTVVTFIVQLIIAMTGAVIVLLYLAFLLLDFPVYVRTWTEFLPETYRGSVLAFGRQFGDVMSRYFRGQAVVALITGLLFVIGFLLIGLPMAVVFGLFIGLLNMVPYLQAVALIPAVALALLRSIESGASVTSSLLLTLLVFVVVQVIQDTVLVPRIMGKATGLRPVAILLGIFVWGKLLGFLGVLLAIPLTCVGIAYYQRFVLLQPASQSQKEPPT